MHRRNDRRGSALVLLSLIFASLTLLVAVSVTGSRTVTVKSQTKAYSVLWSRAILSEYDIHLFEDYGIMAYHGNDAEAKKKLQSYYCYSFHNGLQMDNPSIRVDLGAWSMGDMDNMRKAVRRSALSAGAKALLDRKNKIPYREGEREENRTVKNPVVIDTLPSGEKVNSGSLKAVYEKFKDGEGLEAIKEGAKNQAAEILFLREYFGSHLYAASSRESYFRNEWEYVIEGELDDHKNLRGVRTKLGLLRTALNIYALHQDREKVAAVDAISILLAPEASVLVRETVLAAWAALEAEDDVQVLLDGKRIPLIKGKGDWFTSFGDLKDRGDLLQDLDEEVRQEFMNSSEGESVSSGAYEEVKDGQNYEDYLLFLVTLVDEDTRLLRMMDLIALNMKYRYYDDFNWEEYYTGVSFDVKTFTQSIEAEDHYR